MQDMTTGYQRDEYKHYFIILTKYIVNRVLVAAAAAAAAPEATRRSSPKCGRVRTNESREPRAAAARPRDHSETPTCLLSVPYPYALCCGCYASRSLHALALRRCLSHRRRRALVDFAVAI